MNYSMFSSFEAACAELLGYSTKLKASPSSPPSTKGTNDHRRKNGSTKSEESELAEAGRFAPEFDGLNCFETLILGTKSSYL